MNPNLNSDNLDNNNQDPTNMSDDEKKSYMLNYVRTFRINSNTDVFERLLGYQFPFYTFIYPLLVPAFLRTSQAPKVPNSISFAFLLSF